MNNTDLDAGEYIASLALTEEPSEVYALDGGALWRVTDEHFVLLVCLDHDTHKGPAQLKRVLPPEWELFYTASNPDEQYVAEHWGPPC